MNDFSAYEIWPGPMEGVAREHFVAAVGQLDLVSRWMTPFLRVSDIAAPRRTIEKFLAPFLASGKPVTLQLMGDDPGKIAETARTAAAAGIAGINLNCGCPSRRVVRHKSGGAILADAEKICTIAQCVKEEIGDLPFSLKFRSGLANWHEMEDFLPVFASSAAVDQLFYHCRTVNENYQFIADRETRFRRCAELAGDKSLILNGDLAADETTFSLLGACRASGAMFARNWMRDPFLLRRCEKKSAPSPEEGRRIFFEKFSRLSPPRGAVLEIARMLWGRESENFRNAVAAMR